MIVCCLPAVIAQEPVFQSDMTVSKEDHFDFDCYTLSIELCCPTTKSTQK